MKIRTGNHIHSYMSRSGIKNFLNILKSLIMTLYGQRNIRRVAYRLNQFDDFIFAKMWRKTVNLS